MTKGELLELLSDLEDSDKLVFVCYTPTDRGGEAEDEFRNMSLVCKNSDFETELHLEK